MIAANVVLLLVAPIGGMTLFNALAALLGFSLPLVLPLAVVVVPLVLWWHRRRARRRG